MVNTPVDIFFEKRGEMFRLDDVHVPSDCIRGASIFVVGGMNLYPGFETGGRRTAGQAISSPRIVPVAEANRSVSRPMRCSIETKRLGSG